MVCTCSPALLGFTEYELLPTHPKIVNTPNLVHSQPWFKISSRIGVSIYDRNDTVSVPYRTIPIKLWYF